jgi:uncharacterized damage-inducible protein DinB
MLGKEMLVTQFCYNAWANGRVLNKAAKVDDEQMIMASNVGERSLRQILVHLVQVEKVWRLLAETGQVQPDQLPDDASLQGVDAIERALAEERRRMEAYLGGLKEDDLAVELTITRWDGIKVVMTRWYMLTHLLMHSMQHRSEAAVVLTNCGHSPGDIDFLFYIGSD